MKNKMTKKLLLSKLVELETLSRDGDKEVCHAEADQLLLDFIDDKRISNAFNVIEKWYA
jgi:nicotinate-nucleotide pyrophosphorylase